MRVVFVPGRSTNTTFTNDSAFYKQILDLRETSMFEIDIPYCLPLPFVTKKGNTYDNYGTLNFFLDDRLQCPDSVAQSIQFYLEVACGDDAVWAIPTKSEFLIRSGTGTISATDNYRSRNAVSSYPTDVFDQFTTQSGDCKYKKLDFGVSKNMDKTKLLQYCVGEEILSFKQLCSIPDYIPQRVVNMTTGAGVQFDPFHVWATDYTDATNTGASVNNIGEDTYSLVASCYALATGGVNIFVHNQSSTLDPAGIAWISHGTQSRNSLQFQTPTAPPEQFDPFSTLLRYDPTMSYVNCAYLNNSRSLTMFVPSYVPLPSRVITPGFTQGGSTSRPSIVFGFYTSNTDNSDNSRWVFARSLADDGRFGLFKGVPRIVVDTTATF